MTSIDESHGRVGRRRAHPRSQPRSSRPTAHESNRARRRAGDRSPRRTRARLDPKHPDKRGLTDPSIADRATDGGWPVDRPLSRPQLVTLRAAAAGKLRMQAGRAIVAADFTISRITVASVRACQRRRLLEPAAAATGVPALTAAGRKVLQEGCIKCGFAIEPENTCVHDGEDQICFLCSGAIL